MNWKDIFYLSAVILPPLVMTVVAVWLKCQDIMQVDLTIPPTEMKGGDPVGRSGSTDSRLH